jgi:membrane protein YqaA with SNARE-associated domain
VDPVGENRALILLASAVGVGFASGVVPFVNIELFIAYLGVAAPHPLRPLLLVAATAAHMAGKSVLYLAGRETDRLPMGAFRRRVERARAKIAGRPSLGAVTIAVSAAAGFPPFYFVTVASGVVRYRFLHWLLIGFLGRLLRFAVLLVGPTMLCYGGSS